MARGKRAETARLLKSIEVLGAFTTLRSIALVRRVCVMEQASTDSPQGPAATPPPPTVPFHDEPDPTPEDEVGIPFLPRLPAIIE